MFEYVIKGKNLPGVVVVRGGWHSQRVTHIVTKMITFERLGRR